MIVAVPTYKDAIELQPYEVVSIKNTISKTPASVPIYLFGPTGLNLEKYITHFRYDFKFVYFNASFFESIYSYNLLLKSKQFFKSFSDYDFMLLVQTDAYIFDFSFDQFLQYDYVGAPWQQHIFDTHIKKLFCGNGGFSLRNIQSAIKVLGMDKQALPFKKVAKYTFESEFHTQKSFFKKASDTLNFYFFQNKLKDGSNGLPFLYEDVFWSLIVPEVVPEFKVPDGVTALKFAFDTFPELCFEQNNYQLPKGCHGFNKYSPDFWRKHIPEDF